MKTLYRVGFVCLALTLIAGCNTPPPNDLVTINYTPVGNTDQQNLNTRITDGMFMRFHIDSISNKDTNAVLFHFDPQNLFVIPNGETPAPHVCFPNDNAQAFDVPAGQATTNELGFVTIRVGLGGLDINTLRTLAKDLGYNSNSHVLMVSSNPNHNPVPYVPNPC